MLYRLYRWTLYLTIVRIWESSNYSFISKVCFGRVMLTLTLDLSAINRGLLAPGFGEANKVDVSGSWVFSSEYYLHLWHKWALHHCVSALEQESLRIWSIRLLATFAIYLTAGIMLYQLRENLVAIAFIETYTYFTDCKFFEFLNILLHLKYEYIKSLNLKLHRQWATGIYYKRHLKLYLLLLYTLELGTV